MRIGIVDYGMGNLLSVANAIHEVGGRPELVSSGEDLGAFDKLILPGVGAFSEAMGNLRAQGLIEPLNAAKEAGCHILGICLGMQLMCTSSLEDGCHAGLGWVDAEVLPFPTDRGVKVPHMGWNSVQLVGEHPIAHGVDSGSDVYFVHSYFIQCHDRAAVLGVSDYAILFTSAFSCERLAGFQFHPERSQKVGLAFLRNFVQLELHRC